MKFSEMPYARPDTETVKKQLTELTERLKNAGTYEEAKAAFLEEQKASLAVETQATLASIRPSIDTRDTFYDGRREQAAGAAGGDRRYRRILDAAGQPDRLAGLL